MGKKLAWFGKRIKPDSRSTMTPSKSPKLNTSDAYTPTSPTTAKPKPVNSAPSFKKTPLFPSTRLTVVTLIFTGNMVLYAQRVALSIAIVAMVGKDANLETPRGAPTNESWLDDSIVNGIRTKADVSNRSFVQTITIVSPVTTSTTTASNATSSNINQSAEFFWSSRVQGSVLAAFFYGYATTQFPGGALSSRYGGRLVYAIGSLVSSASMLATPVAARWSWRALWAARFVGGVGQGVMIPTMQGMMSFWAPPLERSFLYSVCMVGANFGLVTALTSASVILKAADWSVVFYSFGVVGIVWVLFWILIVADSPATSRMIKEDERAYIETSLASNRGANDLPDRRPQTPWRRLLTSPHVLVVCVASFTGNWASYTLSTSAPKYMRDILGYDIRANGFLLAMSWLLQLAVMLASAQLADSLRARCFTTLFVRRLFNSLAFGLTLAAFIGLAFVGADHVVGVVLIVAAAGGFGGSIAGYMVNPLDIAPDFAGIIQGVANTFGTCSGFLGAEAMGALTFADPGLRGWRNLFLLGAGLLGVGLVAFLFGSAGEVQNWAKRGENEVASGENKDKVQL